ncbi:MAG: hypothetical protein PVJ67_05200 [Candidatus Pacearchaeota archaeon]|jgi:hypothetical protein
MTNQKFRNTVASELKAWELTEEQYNEIMECPLHMTLSQYEDYKASKMEVEEMEDEDIF